MVGQLRMVLTGGCGGGWQHSIGAKRGKIKGDVRPIEQVWGFAREWYGRHCDPNWTKWTQEEAAEMFARHALTGPIWELPTAQGRF
jgi:hypothetical protein